MYLTLILNKPLYLSKMFSSPCESTASIKYKKIIAVVNVDNTIRIKVAHTLIETNNQVYDRDRIKT